jgi:phosphoribosylanthranilate isomerase
VSSLYQIIWDLSFGENHRGILMVSSTLPGSKKSWCFVNETQLLLPKVLKHDLQVVQLHGKESVTCQELRNQLPKGIEIIKVFSIQDEFDFSALPSKSSAIIFYLILKGNYPGNGTTFDWTVLKKYPSTAVFSQWWYIEELSKVTRNNKTNLPVYAIDVNSKFEIEPGLKKKSMM